MEDDYFKGLEIYNMFTVNVVTVVNVLNTGIPRSKYCAVHTFNPVTIVEICTWVHHSPDDLTVGELHLNYSNETSYKGHSSG